MIPFFPSPLVFLEGPAAGRDLCMCSVDLGQIFFFSCPHLPDLRTKKTAFHVKRPAGPGPLCWCRCRRWVGWDHTCSLSLFSTRSTLETRRRIHPIRFPCFVRSPRPCFTASNQRNDLPLLSAFCVTCVKSLGCICTTKARTQLTARVVSSVEHISV